MPSKVSIQSSILAQLKVLRVCSGLSSKALEALADVASRHRLKKSCLLWEQHEAARYLALVTTGMIEVYRSDVDGNATVFGFFGPEDVIGITATLKRGNYPANSRAMTSEVQLIKIYWGGLSPELDPNILRELEHWVRDRLFVHEQTLREKIDIFGEKRLEAQIYLLIQHLLARFGTAASPGKPRDHLNLPLEKTQIARFLNARVETVIRIMGHWQSEGCIKMGKGGLIILKPDALQQRVLES